MKGIPVYNDRSATPHCTSSLEVFKTQEILFAVNDAPYRTYMNNVHNHFEDHLLSSNFFASLGKEEFTNWNLSKLLLCSQTKARPCVHKMFVKIIWNMNLYEKEIKDT